jgi:hypothetical protein
MARATQSLLVFHLVLLTVSCTFTHLKASMSETACRQRSMYFRLGQYRLELGVPHSGQSSI